MYDRSQAVSKILFRKLKLVKNKDEMDCNGMMGHILQCLVALKLAAKSDDTDLHLGSNTVFQAAVMRTLGGLFDENIITDDRVDFLLHEIFPSIMNAESQKPSWYPLVFGSWIIFIIFQFITLPSMQAYHVHYSF